MAKQATLKVELISHTNHPEQVVSAAIRQCYSSVGASELKKTVSREKVERLISQIVSSGHTSTIEHVSFTFAIEGISRACSHQLVRHRIASYSQQSQRYVDLGKNELLYIIPPEVKKSKKLEKEYQLVMSKMETEYINLTKAGIKPEDARSILPSSCETKIVVTMNARSLQNFFKLRTCKRSQWEIRNLAVEMLKKVKKVAPALFSGVGPACTCEKICWEAEMSCGLWRKISGAELRKRQGVF